MKRLLAAVILYGALLGVGGAVLWALLAQPLEAEGLSPLARAAATERGIGNPVTAVLLDFRAYDTLLEVTVLLLALVGLWSLGRPLPVRESPPSPVLQGFVRHLLPVVVLVAAWLLYAGTFRPGGAFQAGAVLGAGGVLWILSGLPRPHLPRRARRLVASSGVLALLGVGAGVMLLGEPWLRWPDAWVGPTVLLVETFAMISIAAVLAALFTGVPPRADT